jgi:hypothetical protein
MGSPGLRDLFGVRYAIRPQGIDAPSAQEITRVGRFVLSEYPDNRYVEVVDTISPIAADRRNIGEQTSSFLSSGLAERRLIPTVVFGGRAAGATSLGPNEEPGQPPGEVIDSSASIVDGEFGGTVDLERPGVVLLKASFDPRWRATVDGVEVDVQMLAPGFVGVPVLEGEHDVEFVYEAYPAYLLLICAGALVIFGIWAGERALRRTHAVVD